MICEDSCAPSSIIHKKTVLFEPNPFCLAIANIGANTKVMLGLLKLHLLTFIYHRKQVWIGLINRTCLRKRRRSVGVKQPTVQNEWQARCLACYRLLLDIYCIWKKKKDTPLLYFLKLVIRLRRFAFFFGLVRLFILIVAAPVVTHVWAPFFGLHACAALCCETRHLHRKIQNKF